MTTSQSTLSPTGQTRRTVRYLAAGFAAAVGVLYVILMLLVRSAELEPGATNAPTFGGYLALAVAYFIGAVILATVDNRILHIFGVGVQVVVILLFIAFGVGLLGKGALSDPAISHLPLGLWAAVITGAQVALLAMLGYLVDQRNQPPKP